MSRILALDPGITETAWLVYDTNAKRPVDFGIDTNGTVRTMLPGVDADLLAVEMIASYGMPVGREVFETCVWIGRFVESWCQSEAFGGVRYVYRKDVKLHLCGTTKAKDGNVRQAILDLYGSTRRAAIGLKASPGPLYGIKSHLWAAMGVAITAAETTAEKAA